MGHWTPHSHQVMQRLFEEGLTDAVIAERLGRSQIAVDKRRRELGMKRRPGVGSSWTPAQDAMLKDLLATGISFSQIAMEMNAGFSRNACIGRASRLGLSGPVKKFRAPRTPRSRVVNTPRTIRAARERPAPSPIPEPQLSAEFLGVALLDLTPEMCRFPRGEGASILFCGQVTDGDSSWCPACSQVVYARVGTTQQACA